jgi:hypothetical protein
MAILMDWKRKDFQCFSSFMLLLLQGIEQRAGQMAPITVEDGQNIIKKVLGEHKVITPKQQCLGVILCFFMYLKWLWLLCFFAKML